MKTSVLVLATMALCVASTAEAQVYGQAQAQPQPAYGQQTYGQQQPAQGPAQRGGRGIEYGGHIVIPIWLGSDQLAPGVSLSPGIGIQGRAGWEFPGGLTTEVNIGALISSLVDFDESITGGWLGLGARFAFYNPSALVPFVGGGVKFNFWSFCSATSIGSVCDDRSEFTLGFNALVGIAFEVSPYAAVEAGVEWNFTLPGAVFDGSQQYLSPFVGGTLYY